jgi:hypothetical protein
MRASEQIPKLFFPLTTGRGHICSKIGWVAKSGKEYLAKAMGLLAKAYIRRQPY